MLDYVTYKYVRLRDSRLGALYYILALLILIYSLIEIFVRKGYMQVKSKGWGLIYSGKITHVARLRETHGDRALCFCVHLFIGLHVDKLKSILGILKSEEELWEPI